MSQRIAVDFDNTLTKSNNEWWKKDDNPIPDEAVIQWVREQYQQGHTTFIYTARPESSVQNGETLDIRARTKAWLEEHHVPHHALVMDKLSADVYVDDKSQRPEEIKRE